MTQWCDNLIAIVILTQNNRAETTTTPEVLSTITIIIVLDVTTVLGTLLLNNLKYWRTYGLNLSSPIYIQELCSTDV